MSIYDFYFGIISKFDSGSTVVFAGWPAIVDPIGSFVCIQYTPLVSHLYLAVSRACTSRLSRLDLRTGQRAARLSHTIQANPMVVPLID